MDNKFDKNKQGTFNPNKDLNKNKGTTGSGSSLKDKGYKGKINQGQVK